MGCIKCGIVTKHMIFPFLPPVFSCIRFYLTTLIKKTNVSPLVFVLSMFIGEFLAVFWEIHLTYQKKRSVHYNSMSPPTPTNNNTNEPLTVVENKEYYGIGLFKLVESDHSQVKKKHFFYYIVIIALIDTFALYSLSIMSFYDKSNTSLQMKIILLIFTGIFARIILGTEIYRHQILSIILIFISLSCFIFHINQLFYQHFFFYLSFVIIYMIMALQKVLEKWIMLNKFFTPYRLLFFEGIIGIVITCLLAIPLYFIKCPPGWLFCTNGEPIDNLIESLILLFRDNTFCLIYIGGFILCAFLMNLFNLLTNYYLSPTHRAVSDTISSFSWWFISFIMSKQYETEMLFDVFGYLITGIATLIYNEIIILYCCSLEKYTIKEIRERGHEETKMTVAPIDIAEPDEVNITNTDSQIS